MRDYIDPPYVLSEEKSGSEITWTLGEYTEPEVVKNAFAIPGPMPAQYGNAPNQPWSGEAGYHAVWRSFWIASLVALTIQIISVFMSDNRTMYSNAMDVPAGHSGEITTPVFEVTGHTGNIHIINNTNLDNNWVSLDLELVARDTGQVYAVHREVSYYRGCDDECWTEGSTSDEAEIANVPPGNYLLSIDAETEQARGVSTQLQVLRNVPNWHNFFIVEILMLLFPAVYWWRRATFEASRWADSAHPQQTPGEKIMDMLDSSDD